MDGEVDFMAESGNFATKIQCGLKNRSPMSEHRINDLINAFLDKSQKSNLYYERLAIQLWKTELGNFISRYTDTVTMKNGVLYVKLLNASLKFEMLGRKSEIITILNEKIGFPIVKDIIFS